MNKHLYDTFASRWLKDCDSIWVISDTHFGDLESYKFRHTTDTKLVYGKKYYQTAVNIWEDEDSLKCSMECYDEWLIKNINAKAGKNSCLIILGDVGDLECVKNLKAKRKILILGNHDKGASNYKRTYPYIEHYQNDEIVYGTDNHLFDEVYEGPVMINDRVILSHEPIQVPEYIFNIHGHVHDKNNKGDSHHLNVCAEAIDYTPVNLLKSIKDGLLKNIPNIHRPTIDKATTKKAKKSNN